MGFTDNREARLGSPERGLWGKVYGHSTDLEARAERVVPQPNIDLRELPQIPQALSDSCGACITSGNLPRSAPGSL